MSFSYIVIEACGLGSICLMAWFIVKFFKSERND